MRTRSGWLSSDLVETIRMDARWSARRRRRRRRRRGAWLLVDLTDSVRVHADRRRCSRCR